MTKKNILRNINTLINLITEGDAQRDFVKGCAVAKAAVLDGCTIAQLEGEEKIYSWMAEDILRAVFQGAEAIRELAEEYNEGYALYFSAMTTEEDEVDEKELVTA